MNIHIRHAKSDDYIDLLEVYSQPKAMAGTLQLPFPAETVWKKRLSEQSDGICVLVAEVDNKVIGSLGLHLEMNRRRRHVGYIGMAVHDAWHGKGVGSRLLESVIELADNWLNLIRIELTVFKDNEAALSLYRKYGFVEEGVLRKYAFRNGDYCDAIAMARMK